MRLLGVSPERVRARVVPPSGQEEVVPPLVSGSGVSLTFTPQQQGQYQLHVEVDGRHESRPHTILVLAPLTWTWLQGAEGHLGERLLLQAAVGGLQGGPLRAEGVAPSGARTPLPLKVDPRGQVEVELVPQEEGVHVVQVLQDNHALQPPLEVPIRGPPQVNFQGPSDRRGSLGVPFTLRLPQPDLTLQVRLEGGVAPPATYQVSSSGTSLTFTPLRPGAYDLQLLLRGQPLPHAPISYLALPSITADLLAHTPSPLVAGGPATLTLRLSQPATRLLVTVEPTQGRPYPATPSPLSPPPTADWRVSFPCPPLGCTLALEADQVALTTRLHFDL